MLLPVSVQSFFFCVEANFLGRPVYLLGSYFGWLLEHDVVAQPGYSILVYEILDS